MQLTIQWYPRVVNILWRAECRCGESAVREGSKIRSKAAEHLLAMHSGINIAKFMPPSAFLINQRFFGIFVEYLKFFLVFPQFILRAVAFAKLFFAYSALFYPPHVYAKILSVAYLHTILADIFLSFLAFRSAAFSQLPMKGAAVSDAFPPSVKKPPKGESMSIPNRQIPDSITTITTRHLAAMAPATAAAAPPADRAVMRAVRPDGTHRASRLLRPSQPTARPFSCFFRDMLCAFYDSGRNFSRHSTSKHALMPVLPGRRLPGSPSARRISGILPPML